MSAASADFTSGPTFMGAQVAPTTETGTAVAQPATCPTFEGAKVAPTILPSSTSASGSASVAPTQTADPSGNSEVPSADTSLYPKPVPVTEDTLAFKDGAEPKGMIFDIQSYSVHDGPGCRTNVFFCGCPLKCRWCANPESWRPKLQFMFAERTCKWEQGCRACRNACPYGSIQFDEKGQPHVDWKKCYACDTIECSKSCAAGSLKQTVRIMSVDDLVKIFRRDYNNWGSDGGVTFTGGEPLMHHKYLDLVLKEAKKMSIHTAIETSAYASEEVFMKIFRRIDFAFIDVKNMDDEAHKWGTGVSNKRTLGNIRALVNSGWPGRLILRQPTINGFNDSDENAKMLIDFMHELGLYEINLLKFHRMGQTKWEQLGKTYEYSDHGDMTPERMSELQDLYLENDIACYVGDDTPF